MWRAYDPQRGGDVALKILHAPAARAAALWAALVREHAIASRLDHPGILKVFAPEHLGEDALLLPMELAPGGDLRRMRGSGYLLVVPVLIEIAQALEHAHERSVIHRDLKPGNVLFDAHGAVKLADFGASETMLERGESEGRRLSPFSASPQQLRGEAPSPADDIYGLGALGYELLSRYPPHFPHFDARRVQFEPVPELKPAEPLPPLLGVLIGRMLSKDAASRPAAMAEVIEELEAALNDTVTFDFDTAEPPREVEPVDWRPPPREPLASAAVPPISARPPPPPAPPPLQLGPEVVDSHLVMDDLRPRTVPPLLRLEPMRGSRKRTLVVAALILAAAAGVWFWLPPLSGFVPPAARPASGALATPAGADAGSAVTTAAPAARGDTPTASPAASSGATAGAVATPDTSAQDTSAKVRLLADRTEFDRRMSALATPDGGTRGGADLASARASAAESTGAYAAGNLPLAREWLTKAMHQLDRAERHGGSSALTTQLAVGRQALDAGELQEAARAFQQAQEIDPHNQQAQRGLAQANAALADDDYAAAAGEGFDALAAGRLEEARAAFERARSLRPDGVAAVEGLRRVDQAARTAGGGSP